MLPCCYVASYRRKEQTAACRHSGVVGRIADPVELQAAQMRAEALLADKQALARRHATMTE